MPLKLFLLLLLLSTLLQGCVFGDSFYEPSKVKIKSLEIENINKFYIEYIAPLEAANYSPGFAIISNTEHELCLGVIKLNINDDARGIGPHFKSTPTHQVIKNKNTPPSLLQFLKNTSPLSQMIELPFPTKNICLTNGFETTHLYKHAP